MPGTPYTFNRTKCPICGSAFSQGTGKYHYEQAHAEYSKWTSLWTKILALLFVPAFLAVIAVGDILGPTLVKNMLFQEVVVSYFLGSIVLMLGYRFFIERRFRSSWKEEHPSELSKF